MKQTSKSTSKQIEISVARTKIRAVLCAINGSVLFCLGITHNFDAEFAVL